MPIPPCGTVGYPLSPRQVGADLINEPLTQDTSPYFVSCGPNPRRPSQETSQSSRARTVRPLQGRETWMGRNPWAAGTKTVPLPTATRL
jgi:hypothetical protein